MGEFCTIAIVVVVVVVVVVGGSSTILASSWRSALADHPSSRNGIAICHTFSFLTRVVVADVGARVNTTSYVTLVILVFSITSVLLLTAAIKRNKVQTVATNNFNIVGVKFIV